MRALTFLCALVLASAAGAEETPAPDAVPSPPPPASEAPATPPPGSAEPAPAAAPAPEPAPAAAPEAPNPPAPPVVLAPPVKEHVASEKELVDDDGYVVRLSLPTQADTDAWKAPGLRIGLGFGRGKMWGRAPALDLAMTSFTLRALVRLDELWSVGVDFQYAGASATAMDGLRFASTLQAILNPWRQLGLGVGLGYGGFQLSPPRGRAVSPATGEEVASLTYGAGTKLGTCTGNAWLGLARAEYQFVVGQLFASGPYVEANMQYTLCEQTLGRTDRETGMPLQGRQWWQHTGASGGWWVTWR